MQLRRITLISYLVVFSIITAWSQETVSLTPEEVEGYTEQSKQLIQFLEGTLNFLGDPNEVTSEKDIIINQSYAKIFQSDETQVEDDLDPNREMALNKDVQAYLKDIDFFFKKVHFTFEINAVDQLVSDNGQLVFKVTLNRHLKGVTVDNDTLDNNQIRYVEINLNPVDKDLKIASIYTTKPDQKEELRYWWEQMAQSWRDYFGDTIVVFDTLHFSKIHDFTDSALILNHWAEDIRIDTMMAYGGDTVYLDRVPDSVRYLGDTVYFSTTHYIQVSDTIPVNVSVIFNYLLKFKALTKVDISWNMSITNLNPLTELTDLKEIYFTNTLIDDISPLRNLNDLEFIECSGSKIRSLDPLRYASNLKEMNLLATQVNDIGVLANLKNLSKLNIGETQVTNIDTLSSLTGLSQLDLSNLQLDDFNVLSDLKNLMDLTLAGTNIITLDPLSGLNELRTLNIGNTEVTDLGPLKNLKNLAILQANYSKINDLEPLSGMPALKYIYCDNTGITGAKAQQFMAANAGCLVIFNTEELKQWWYDLPPVYKEITRQKIEISEPITTEQLHTIIKQTQVDLSGHPEITQIEPLKMLHRLEKIDLENTNVTDLSPLSGLNNLTEINIDNTHVKSLKPLNDLQNLKLLKCKNTMVTDLLYLANNTNLQAVYCDHAGVPQDNAIALKEILPNCLIVYQSDDLLKWWNNLGDAWKSVLANQIKLEGEPTPESLQRLVDLEKVEIYDNSAIQKLDPLKPFLRLKILTVSNTRVSDISPLRDLPKLKELNLPNNPIAEVPQITKFRTLVLLNLENTAIEDLKIIGQAYWIKTLNIAGTKIKKLKGIEGMTDLENLMINNTLVKNLNELEELPNLKQLTCYRTRISDKTIAEFRLEFPNVEVDYY